MLLASKQLGKLQSANEEIDTLKDELTQVLKSNTLQRELLDEYKVMVEGKCDLQYEKRVGPRGAVRSSHCGSLKSSVTYLCMEFK